MTAVRLNSGVSAIHRRDAECVDGAEGVKSSPIKLDLVLSLRLRERTGEPNLSGLMVEPNKVARLQFN